VALYSANIRRTYKLHQITVTQKFLNLYTSDLHGTAYNTIPDDTQENRIKQCINYLLNVLYRYKTSTDSLVTIRDRSLEEF